MLKIYRSDEILHKEDKKPYGDVQYADPGYQPDGKKRYPVDTEQHIRAAWSYINKPDNAGQYTSAQVARIKQKIVAAWKKKIDKDGPPSAASKSLGQAEPGLTAMFSPPALGASMEAPEVMETLPVTAMAYDEARDPVSLNSNYTCVTMEYAIQDGLMMPTCLHVYNQDSDPSGEEPDGSEAEKREMNHYAQVLNCISRWLLTGEEQHLENEDDGLDKDIESTRDEGADTPAREDLSDIAYSVAGIHGGAK